MSKQSGFTLIEIMASLVVIVILMTAFYMIFGQGARGLFFAADRTEVMSEVQKEMNEEIININTDDLDESHSIELDFDFSGSSVDNVNLKLDQIEIESNNNQDYFMEHEVKYIYLAPFVDN